MRVLQGGEELLTRVILEETAQLAQQASCLRSRCGSMILCGTEVIGRGVNTPPGESEAQRRCTHEKTSYHPRVTDKTCCIHAEQRAIMDALRTHPEKLVGARLVFARLASDGTVARAGAPYCTICSKMALDVGIKEFVLWHEEGITVYDTQEYNTLSFAYTDTGAN